MNLNQIFEEVYSCLYNINIEDNISGTTIFTFNGTISLDNTTVADTLWDLLVKYITPHLKNLLERKTGTNLYYIAFFRVSAPRGRWLSYRVNFDIKEDETIEIRGWSFKHHFSTAKNLSELNKLLEKEFI